MKKVVEVKVWMTKEPHFRKFDAASGQVQYDDGTSVGRTYLHSTDLVNRLISKLQSDGVVVLRPFVARGCVGYVATRR